MEIPETTALLERLGLAGPLKQIAANAALGAATARAFAASGLPAGDIDKGVAALLFAVASGLPEARAEQRSVVCAYVGRRALTTSQQVGAAVDYMKKRVPDAPFVAAEFEAACGAGVSLTDEDVRAKASELVAAHRAAIEEQRFAFAIGPLMNAFREGVWRWADGGKAKAFIDEAFAAVVGEDSLRKFPRCAGSG